MNDADGHVEDHRATGGPRFARPFRQPAVIAGVFRIGPISFVETLRRRSLLVVERTVGVEVVPVVGLLPGGAPFVQIGILVDFPLVALVRAQPDEAGVDIESP